MHPRWYRPRCRPARRAGGALADAFALLEETEFAIDALTILALLHAHQGRFDEAEHLYQRAQSMNPHWFRRVQNECQRTWCALMAGRVDAAVALVSGTQTRPNRRATPSSSRAPSKSPLRPRSAREDEEVAHQLFVRALAYAREHDLRNIPDILAELAVVGLYAET